MFTGIIRAIGRVINSQKSPQGIRLTIVSSSPFVLHVGESLAVNGCCLTLAACGKRGELEFDLVPETLRLTALAELRSGDEVNLETAIPAGAPLSGHIVQGHVDGVASAAKIGHDAGGEVTLEITPPIELMDYIMPKGSIAIDGVSLTVAAVESDRFRIALIPETLRRTTLSRIGPGPVRVNVEVDLIAKIVVWHLRRQQASGAPE